MNQKNPIRVAMISIMEDLQFLVADKTKEKIPCLWCKKEKRHNNSFCSAKCCKEYNIMQVTLRKNSQRHEEEMRLQRHFKSKCSIVDKRILHGCIGERIS
jgi:hypothetical protein